MNINTLSIEPFNPDFYFFNKLPVRYDPTADCPAIKKFLSEIVPADQVPVLQEITGFCLLKNYNIQKAIMLVGSGSNGKSTFLKLLKAFIGAKNCAAIPLHQLENNIFASSSLFGKLANCFGDLSAKALTSTSILKMLTGGDLIPAERKFKDKFFFTNYAKLIFSCNQIPRSPDDTDAFFRRWVILVFPNQFLGDADDKQLIDKLTTPEELSGFLNFAIEGLRRLLSQGDFTGAKSIEDVREDYIRKSDSVAAFVMDCIDVSTDGFENKKQLYTEFCDYCRKMNYPVVAENTFHQRLQHQIRVEDYFASEKMDGKTVRSRCWKGIALKDLNGKKPEQYEQSEPKENGDVQVVQDVQVFSNLKFSEEGQQTHSNSEVYDYLLTREIVTDKDFEQFNWKKPWVWMHELRSIGYLSVDGRVLHERLPK